MSTSIEHLLKCLNSFVRVKTDDSELPVDKMAIAFLRTDGNGARSDIRASEALFYLGLGIWLVSATFETSSLDGRYTEFRIMGFCVALFSALLEMRTRTLLLSDLLLLVAFLLAWHGDDLYICQTLVLAYCARSFDFRSIVSACLAIQAGVVALILLLCVIGIAPDEISMSPDGAVRHSVGFIHPATLGHHYLNFTLMYFYLKRGRLSLIESLTIVAIDLLIWKVGGVSVALLPTVLVLVAKVAEIWRDRQGKRGTRRFLRAAAVCWFPLMVAISIVVFLMIDPNSPLGTKLDSLLSQRVSLSNTALNTYGITLFGSNVQFNFYGTQGIGNSYFFIDNSYLQILFVDGLVELVVVVLLFCRLMSQAAKASPLIAFVLAFYGINAFIDPQLLQLQYCVFLLLLGATLEPEKEKATEEDSSYLGQCG